VKAQTYGKLTRARTEGGIPVVWLVRKGMFFRLTRPVVYRLAAALRQPEMIQCTECLLQANLAIMNLAVVKTWL